MTGPQLENEVELAIVISAEKDVILKSLSGKDIPDAGKRLTEIIERSGMSDSEGMRFPQSVADFMKDDFRALAE